MVRLDLSLASVSALASVSYGALSTASKNNVAVYYVRPDTLAAPNLCSSQY